MRRPSPVRASILATLLAVLGATTARLPSTPTAPAPAAPTASPAAGAAPRALLAVPLAAVPDPLDLVLWRAAMAPGARARFDPATYRDHSGTLVHHVLSGLVAMRGGSSCSERLCLS